MQCRDFLLEPHLTIYLYYSRSFSQPGVIQYLHLEVGTTNSHDKLHKLTSCCASDEALILKPFYSCQALNSRDADAH